MALGVLDRSIDYIVFHNLCNLATQVYYVLCLIITTSAKEVMFSFCLAVCLLINYANTTQPVFK